MKRGVERSVGAALVLLAASAARAQDTGSIRGTVADTTGAPIPGVSVTLASESTRFSRKTVTNDRGQYFFGAVSADVYTVTAALPGFKTRELRGVRLRQRDTGGLDFALEVGPQSETVEVLAAREMIRTETGAREGVVTGEQIDNLSIVSRSPLELLRVLPGAVMPDVSSLETVGNNSGVAENNQLATYTVNGIRGSNTVITLDGSRLTDVGSNNGVIVVPNNDMVSEVKVQASNYAAEYGSAGLQVNAVTRSGSSEFHGTAYTYMRHYAFQANDASNRTAGIERPESEFWYPGGNVSGPLLIPGTDFNKDRDKAFFFFGAELQRQRLDGGTSLAVTPTERQRLGFFDDTQGGQGLSQPDQVLIPGGFPGAGTPAPNDDLSPYVDPFGQALINRYPLPNYTDPDNRYNYAYNQVLPQDRLQLMLRLDYTFSDSTKAYLRLARDGEDLDRARGVWGDTSSYELPSSVLHQNRGRSALLNVTSVLDPSATNEVLVTWSKLELDIFHTDPGATTLSGLGFPDFAGPWGQQVDRAPIQRSWGNFLGGLVDPLGQDLFAYNSSLQIADTFTKVLNTHAVKIGVSVERVRKDQNFTNNEQMTFFLGAGWIPGTTGNDFGDLITGRLAQVDAGTAVVDGSFELWNIDVFAQDSWKIRKNLTLEYGVRLSKMTNNVERNGLGSVFVPETYDPDLGAFVDEEKRYLNGVQYAELGQVDDNLVDSRPLFVMPRVSFAWDIKGDGGLILRGGAGLFYNRPQGNAEYGLFSIPPYARAISVTALDRLPPGFDYLTYDSLQYIDPLSRLGTQGATTVSPASIDYPRYLTTSLSLGTRLPWEQFLEVGYVGTFGRHLLNLRRVNVIDEGALLSGTVGNADLSVPVNRVALTTDALTTFRPFPALGDVSYWEFNGTSNYHSLQATLSRQTSGRFQYLLAYTFSKALGLWSNEGQAVDPFDERNRSYGVLPHDRTHVLTVSYNWQVPDLTGSDSGFLKGLLNDWQISGISSFSSGIPMRIRLEGDLGTAGLAQAWRGTPDISRSQGSTGAIPMAYSCDPRLDGGALGEKVLDVGCLEIPAFPEVGPYVSPFYLRSPGRHTHDITLFKNFPLGGSKKLQIRAGFFNIFNQSTATYNLGYNDIDLLLETQCNVRVDGVPNGSGGFAGGVCDPAGGFHYTDNTLESFGEIILERGRRIVEFAVKLYF